MTDLASFSQRDFSPEAWINEACLRKPADESIDRSDPYSNSKVIRMPIYLQRHTGCSVQEIMCCRYLAELEMRLHLCAEDLDASLEDDSTRALRRIPQAVQEACSVKVTQRLQIARCMGA